MKYKIGSVPYLNAKPLIKWFELNHEEAELTQDIPSKLPLLLHEGNLDAILTSSIEALRTPGFKAAYGAAICTSTEVTSVKIFSKVHPAQIRTLALDKSSLTSNNLAQIILIEQFNIRPKMRACEPNLEEMLQEFDAAVLIGDNCMKVQEHSYYELDLGTEWYHLTHLPFVWALWMGRSKMETPLVDLLNKAKAWGIQNRECIAEEFAEKSSLPLDQCRNYISKVIQYNFGERQLEGLSKFQHYLLKHNLIEEAHFPEIVRPSS
jgi:chorismate dehydratase